MRPRQPVGPTAATVAPPTAPPVHLGRTPARPPAATTAGGARATARPLPSARRCPSVATPPSPPVFRPAPPAILPAARARQEAPVATPARPDRVTTAGRCPATAPPLPSALR